MPIPSDVAAITGLKPDTTYHFQLWARGESGFWEKGKDMTFKTAGKPVASTKPATDLAPNSARLNGTVNPNGIMTTHYWEYGPTTAYGVKTQTWGDGSGTTAQNVWAQLSGLSGTTTYHFRFVAVNGAGTVYGDDMTFATTPPAPSVTTGPAGRITTKSAVLTGTVNPNGLQTTCHFEYGKTTSYAAGIGVIAAGNGTGSVPIKLEWATFDPGTTYHYKLACENSTGPASGADMTFTTNASLELKGGQHPLQPGTKSGGTIRTK